MQRERLDHLHYVTYIAQTRLTNNNWRQKLGYAFIYLHLFI